MKSLRVDIGVPLVVSRVPNRFPNKNPCPSLMRESVAVAHISP